MPAHDPGSWLIEPGHGEPHAWTIEDGKAGLDVNWSRLTEEEEVTA